MKTGISPGQVDPLAPVQTLAFFFPGNIYAHPYSNYTSYKLDQKQTILSH